MKKIILILLILITTNLNIHAESTQSEIINSIETSMFGYDYNTESESTRLDRIEEQLYGEKKKGTINARLKKIQSDIGYSEPIKKTEKIENNDSFSNQLKEDSTVDYPIVDKLEQEVFKTTYKTENIYKRLERLETKIFNQVSNDNLSNRVNNLTSVIRPAKKIKKENDLYSNSDLDNYYRNNGLEPVSDQSFPFQLANLEQKILKNDYMNDNISNRLGRLEQKLFSRTFTEDNDITRLQRIMVAYDAKQDSYKYENNRKMQNMATVSQWGGILLMILAMLL